MRPAASLGVNHDCIAMFKITQNTLRASTLAEVLLMAAMNQLEAKSKAFENEESQLIPYRADAA